MEKIRKFSGNAVLEALKMIYLTKESEENNHFEYVKIEETKDKKHKGFILHLKEVK